MMRTWIPLVALALPLVGRAQVTAVSQMTDMSFNRADCDSSTALQATFTFAGSVGLGAQYSLFAVNANAAVGTPATQCATQPSAGAILVDNEPLPLDLIVELPGDHDLNVGDLLEGVCDGDGHRGDRLLCLRVTDGMTTYGTGNGLIFSVDTQVPGTPSAATWQGGDGAVVLSAVTVPGGVASDETLTFVVEIRPCQGTSSPFDAAVVADAVGLDRALEDGAAEDGGADAGAPDVAGAADAAGVDAAVASSQCGATAAFARGASGLQLPLRVRGLQNGASYEVRVRVQDGAGNQSGAGAQAVVVPQPEYGFWDVYQGAEEGSGVTSCAQLGGGAWLAALGLLLPALWRRRRCAARALPSLLALAIALAGPARADVLDVGVHLAGGPYHPDLDTEPGASDVYRCVFDDKTWVLGALGLDLVLFDMFGTLSVGGELGYFTVGGRERLDLGSGGCGTASSSTNTLHLVPLSANLHYRFDWPYHMWGFPLAPYGRIGLNATPWAITRNGLLESTGGPLYGVRTGWQWAAGLALVLDVIDEAAMPKVRDSGAFQHAYLFAEWRELRVDSFGAPGFVLGDSTWLVGLALDL